MKKRKPKGRASAPARCSRRVAHMAHLKRARARTRYPQSTPATVTAQRAFLLAYAKVGNVRGTCELSGIGRRTHYNWLETDTAYAQAFEDAKAEAVDRLEQEARRRALVGVEEAVYGKLPGVNAGTGVVGRVRKYSDHLLIFLLKGLRPEVYTSRHELTGKDGAPLNPAPAPADLSKLTIDELIALEQLVLKSTPDETARRG